MTTAEPETKHTEAGEPESRYIISERTPPQPAHYLQAFVCAASPLVYAQAGILELGRVFSANAHAQRKSPVGRCIQRRCHPGQHQRVIEGRQHNRREQPD